MEIILSLSEETIFSFYLTTIIRTQMQLMVPVTPREQQSTHKEEILAQWLSPLKVA